MMYQGKRFAQRGSSLPPRSSTALEGDIQALNTHSPNRAFVHQDVGLTECPQ